MSLSKGQAGEAGASSHLTSTQLILGDTLGQSLPPLPFVVKQELTRLWDPSPALQLGGQGDRNLPSRKWTKPQQKETMFSGSEKK